MRVRAEVDFIIDGVLHPEGEWFELDPAVAEQYSCRGIVKLSEQKHHPKIVKKEEADNA